MHLGLVIYGELDAVSGGYLYDRKLVETCEQQGDRVDIISLPWRNYARHVGDNFSPALYRQLLEAEYDMLLQDELNHPSLFWLNRRLRKRVRYPVVSIVHHLRSKEAHGLVANRFYRLIERRYLNNLDAFIYNSETTRSTVEELAPDTKPYVVAHPAGDRLQTDITEEHIRQRAHTAGSLRIAFLGNVIQRKGLHTLLAALEPLPTKDWCLDIAGGVDVEPDYVRKMRAIIEQHGWHAQVRFLDTLQDIQLVEFLRNSQVLVLPSLYEGFGIAYLEGMAFGLPAIGSTAGGAVEIITHGEDGYLIAPGDALSLARHLQALIADRALLARMSLAARKRFERHTSWEKTTKRVREFLLGLK